MLHASSASTVNAPGAPPSSRRSGGISGAKLHLELLLARHDSDGASRQRMIDRRFVRARVQQRPQAEAHRRRRRGAGV